MMGIPTCEQVAALLTDLDEGALGPLAWTGVRIHLSLCPPCRAFLDSLRHTPALLRGLLREEPGPAPAAERALSSALNALRRGSLPQGPQLHPEAADWSALGSEGNPIAALLLRVHLGGCGACRSQHPSDLALEPGGGPLPTSLRVLLPPETQWRWMRHGLGGGQAARILLDPVSGASLHLVRLPEGHAFPSHRHLGRETTLLLAGGLQDGPAHLHTGDWNAYAPDTLHAPVADSGEECWALVHLEGRIRFDGWRRLLN